MRTIISPTSEPSSGTAAGYATEPPSPGEGIHLLDYVRTLYKRRWIALTTCAAVVSIVAWIVLRAQPIYEARVQLLIENENRNIVLFKEVIEQDTAAKDYQQTQHRILQSRSLAKATLDRLLLWNNTELAGSVRQEPVTGVSRVAASVTRWFRGAPGAGGAQGSSGNPRGPLDTRAGAETVAQSLVLDAFLSRVSVTPIRNTSLVDVKIRMRDPILAARLANGLADAYIEQNVKRQLGASQQANDWLAQQLTQQRKQVEASEVALQRYRERNDAIALDDPNNIVLQKLTELNAAVTKAKTRRIERESIVRQVRTLPIGSPQLDSVPQILGNSYIQQLKADLAALQREELALSEQVGDRNPDLVKHRAVMAMAEKKLSAEVGKVVQSLEGEFLASEAEEHSLLGALEAQKNEALALNRKAIDFAALQREATSNRQIFETLLQRARESGISSDLETNNIQIVDPANVPQAPVWPQKRRALLLGLLAGTALALGAAFFCDYLDDRVKCPEDIRAHLNLPFLGLVPTVRDRKRAQAPLINNDVSPKFIESFQTVRSNLLFSMAENGGKTVLIASTGPNEGKTIVATNLALALMGAGLRTILIDADLRRASVPDVLNLQGERGLAEVLRGDITLAEAVQTLEGPVKLAVLAAGACPPNPADLLGSPAFQRLLQTLTAEYAWIIIDSPPVLAVTDASLIAHISSGVIFVVGADRTSRHAAQAALERLDAAHATFVGSVLNGVDLERHAYYYSKYYRREYAAYYTPEGRAS